MQSTKINISEINTELSTSNFDAISYIDSLLPDDSSLSELPIIINNIQNHNKATTSSVRKLIRTSSALGDSSETILAEIRHSIDDLTSKINSIRDKAKETEIAVNEICENIKPLDNAKKNLTSTVTTLRRLQMLSTTITELESNISSSNYTKCSANVLALTSLFEYFHEYGLDSQLKPFSTKFFDLKRVLRNKVNTDFESMMFSGSADSSNLPLCSVIDSFNDDFHSSIVERFCDQLLSPYEDSYPKVPLSAIHTRFQWFKQRIDFYNNHFHNAFPKEWRMSYNLSLKFCKRTFSHLSNTLRKQAPDINEYLRAFELTVKFERKMAESFSTTKTVFIEPDAKMPNFENTSDGIRKKYEWLYRRDKGIGEEKVIPANEFIGIIANAFSPYMDLYFDSERKNLTNMINDALKNPILDLNISNHTLKSASNLVLAMKKTIDKTSGFGISQSLLSLFRMLKELLVQYVVTLSKMLPTRIKNDEHYQLICGIINTSSLLLNVLDSLLTKVNGLVEDNIKPNIVIDDAKESISEELKKQILYLENVLIKECEYLLIQIGNNSWRNDGTSTKIPEKLLDFFDRRMRILCEWLSNENLNRIRAPFVHKIVLIIHDSIFKEKQIAATHVLQTVKELKNVICQVTKADSQMARKRIEFEFASLEAELTVLCCTNAALTMTYLTVVQNKSKAHFLSIVKLKGFTSEEALQKYAAEYDKQITELKAMNDREK
ncbi:vacuolar protein sorting-associated protein 53 A-like [Histomonas meleagridis]|uniref:vacuolar protein sorting-associated protein 53 A-like n=1 Tax=Histomonas meleagridis TaxID=135588 RepID=UPI0035599DC5|nr:vacuolar protein sorting-associated protein 53 A-like [Histomonas meleagridis]KAH0797674.1 vacuolar protein sorting-associated protein 53 A-like [Histomonas meleagridis]